MIRFVFAMSMIICVLVTPAMAVNPINGFELMYDERHHHATAPTSDVFHQVGGWKLSMAFTPEDAEAIRSVEFHNQTTGMTIEEKDPNCYDFLGEMICDYDVWLGHNNDAAGQWYAQVNLQTIVIQEEESNPPIIQEEEFIPAIVQEEEFSPIIVHEEESSSIRVQNEESNTEIAQEEEFLVFEPLYVTTDIPRLPLIKLRRMRIKKNGDLVVNFKVPDDPSQRESNVHLRIFDDNENIIYQENFYPPYEFVRKNGTIKHKVKVILPGEYAGHNARLEYCVEGARTVLWFALPQKEE